MKKRWIQMGMIVLFIILLIGYAGNGQKERKIEPEFVLTYAENHPKEYPTTQGAFRFAELVEERTDGKVQIQVRYGGEFGTQQEIVNQMKFGGIDFARVSLSSVSDELPRLNVLQLPYLYEDSEHMWRVLDGEIGNQFWDCFYDLNLIPISWYDGGARNFYSTEPITQCEDMEGLVVRVQESEMMRDMITLLGGIPVDVAYSEVYSAIETGEIDAAENSWPSYVYQKHYEVAQYYTLDEHTRVPEIQLASGRTWEKLPEEYQKIILNCGKESAEYERKIWEESEAASREEALSHNCTEIVLPEEEVQKFRDQVAPLYEKYCSNYMEIIEEIKKQAEH
ncbi:MAG: TRAP transporter substrate-binding protein [Dorea sp.]